MLAYGYEQPVVFTPQLIYDQQSANAVLQSMSQYATMLKDDYERAREDYKDFMKEYGAPDFASSLAGANDAYYNETTGKINKLINTYGIDNLLRSAEGRNMIRGAIANINYPKLATIKQSAKNYEELLQDKAKAIADGKYNEEFDKFADDYADASNWDPNKLWTRRSVSRYKDFHDIAEKFFENYKPVTYLGQKNDKNDPNSKYYRVYGVGNEDIEASANATLESMTGQERRYWMSKMLEKADEHIQQSISELNARWNQIASKMKDLKAAGKNKTKEYENLRTLGGLLWDQWSKLSGMDPNSKEYLQMRDDIATAKAKEIIVQSQMDHLLKTEKLDEMAKIKYQEALLNARATADRILRETIHKDEMSYAEQQRNMANTPSYSLGLLTETAQTAGILPNPNENGKQYAARIAKTFKPGYEAPATQARASYIKPFMLTGVDSKGYLTNQNAKIMTITQFNDQQGNGKAPQYIAYDEAKDIVGTSAEKLRYTGNTRPRYSGGVMRIYAEFTDKKGNIYMSPTSIISENVTTPVLLQDGSVVYGLNVHQNPDQQYSEMYLNKTVGVKSKEESMGYTTVPALSIFRQPVE